MELAGVSPAVQGGKKGNDTLHHSTVPMLDSMPVAGLHYPEISHIATH